MKRALGLLLFLAACGTDSTTSNFVGTWTYNPGSTVMRTCPDTTLNSTSMLTGSFQLADGTMSDIIAVPQSGDQCPAVKYDITGKVATIVAGQTCMYTQNTTSGTVMTMIAYATGTFTLGADNKSVTGAQAGSVTFTGAGSTQTCSFTGTLSAGKVGN